MAIKKRLATYYAIYEQVYENPGIPLYEIAQHTKIPQSSVSRYLAEMYASSVLKGPMIFLNPAHNYWNYAHFLTFEHPLMVYRRIKGFPYMISRNLSSGAWNLLLVCERQVNFSQFRGFTSSFFRSIKGVTHIPKVRFLDWDQSMNHMHQLLSCPKEKSTLYREGPPICWNKKEWTLYQTLKWNTRVHKVPVLKECNIRYEHYKTWVTQLPCHANISTAFYPHGADHYFLVDFLFHTHYHTQLADILGMLPATSIFFSVGNHLFARVSFLNKRQEQDLFTFIYQLGDHGFYTHFHSAAVVSPSVI
jgi:hypothetical protein